MYILFFFFLDGNMLKSFSALCRLQHSNRFISRKVNPILLYCTETNKMPETKAVIFDLGGVVVPSPLIAFSSK
jgi:hypothetical protein